MHLLTTPSKLVFSRAAATRSLSASCLLMAASEAWLPGVMLTSTLNLRDSDSDSIIFFHKPKLYLWKDFKDWAQPCQLITNSINAYSVIYRVLSSLPHNSGKAFCVYASMLVKCVRRSTRSVFAGTWHWNLTSYRKREFYQICFKWLRNNDKEWNKTKVIYWIWQSTRGEPLHNEDGMVKAQGIISMTQTWTKRSYTVESSASTSNLGIWGESRLTCKMKTSETQIERYRGYETTLSHTTDTLISKIWLCCLLFINSHVQNGLIHMYTHLLGKVWNSLRRMLSPMREAMLQWGMVGVNSTRTWFSASLTSHWSSLTCTRRGPEKWWGRTVIHLFILYI